MMILTNHAADIFSHARERSGLSEVEVCLLLEKPKSEAHHVGLWEAPDGRLASDEIIMLYYRRRIITKSEAIEALFGVSAEDSVRPLIYAALDN